jgi:hypothetical protein
VFPKEIQKIKHFLFLMMLQGASIANTAVAVETLLNIKLTLKIYFKIK